MSKGKCLNETPTHNEPYFGVEATNVTAFIYVPIYDEATKVGG